MSASATPLPSRNCDLRQSARQRDGAYCKEVADREMQADAEHQQDDADFGELAREIGVSDKSRCERTQRHPGEEITDERRQAQPMGCQASEEGQHEPHGNRGDERDVVRHSSPGGAACRSRSPQ